MAIYVVMEAAGGSGVQDDSRAAYVRDGFSFLAFLFPAIWLLWHRLWIEALLVLAVLLCLGSFGALAGFGAGAATLLSLLIGFYVGLEGPALRIAALRRRGWREWGVVRAADRDEAEMRHLLASADEPERATPAAREPARPWSAKTGGPALGLLGYSGGR